MSKMFMKNMIKAVSLLIPCILWGCSGGQAMVSCQADGFAPGQSVIVNVSGGKQLRLMADGNGVVAYQIPADIGCGGTTPIDPGNPGTPHPPIQP